MALCKDTSLTYLNSLGYNVVRLPRTGIEPLERARGKTAKASNDWVGSTRCGARPSRSLNSTPHSPERNINGQKTDELKLSVGLKMLASVLNAMGAAIPELSFAYQRATAIRFMLTNVHVISVDPFNMGDYLSAGDLHSHNPFVVRYFTEDDTDAFILTEVLKSDRLTVVASTDDGVEVSVDVPAIQQVLGATVAVSASNARHTEITYQGRECVTFGFKAFSVAYEHGAWRVQGLPPAAALAFPVPGQPGGEASADLQPAVWRERSMIVVR